MVNYQKQMAVHRTEMVHISPYVGKSKMHLRGEVYLKNCKQTAENCKQTAENQKNWTPLKRILALPTWGQKCIVSEL